MDTISTGGVTAVVVDDEDGNRATVVVEASDTEEPLREEIRFLLFLYLTHNLYFVF